MASIGPLTNLAALVAGGAVLPPLTIMGRRFTAEPIDGVPERIGEWNWFCDSEAVRTVLAGGHPASPRVVPADVTFRTRLGDGDVDRLADGDELARFVAGQCALWLHR